MKYKILYHMIKTVKASLKGGTPEEDVRREIDRTGLERLSKADISRLMEKLSSSERGPLYLELQERLYQILEEEVRREIDRTGLERLSKADISRLMEKLLFSSPDERPSSYLELHERLQGRLHQILEEEVRNEVAEKGGVDSLTREVISRLIFKIYRLPSQKREEPLLLALQGRLYQLLEEEIRSEIEGTGLQQLTMDDISRLINAFDQIPLAERGPSYMELQLRRNELRRVRAAGKEEIFK